MVYAIQKAFAEIGEAGCHFLCFCITAMRMKGQQIDIIQAFYDAKEAGELYYNDRNTEDKRNLDILDSQKLMSLLVGQEVIYQWQSPGYAPAPGEFVIEEWKWKTIHFVLPDYDPLGESLTHKNGRCISKRVFKLKGA